MKQVIIENPIINSAFNEPKRHFRFDDEGITGFANKAHRFKGWDLVCPSLDGVRSVLNKVYFIY
ncbi:hypothetical protein [Crocosphaera sp. Alani8]|uniref:hypothetical protein n=1 Tax=Crocosphaera sp. Alani8 TaxID=3038952 RepID=UPI00313CC2D2